MKTKVAYIYILGASGNPDRVECLVPFKIDEKEIFFGPCKRPLRKLMKDKYLSSNMDNCQIKDEIYFIGVNSLREIKERKIVWVGKIKEVMSFEFAFNNLNESKYNKMRNHTYSPLHVKPLYENNLFIGYQLSSKEHEENNYWINDLVASRKNLNINNTERKIISTHSEKRKPFERDICILFENIFFAEDKGISIDDEIVNILQESQPNKIIDSLAIFGKNKLGYIYGRGHIEIKDKFCESLIEIIKDKVKRL